VFFARCYSIFAGIIFYTQSDVMVAMFNLLGLTTKALQVSSPTVEAGIPYRGKAKAKMAQPGIPFDVMAC